jgi:hypothetical protein
MKFFLSLFALSTIDFARIKNKINNVFIDPPKIKRMEFFHSEYNGENQIFIRPFTIPKKYEKIFKEITEKNIAVNENIQGNPRVVVSRKLPVSIYTSREKEENQYNETKKDTKKEKIDTSSPLYQINELLLTIVQYYIAYLVLHKLLG